MTILRFRKSNARGFPVGEGHHNSRHADAVVDEARALRARGWTHVAIADALGAPRPTVTAWLLGTRRVPHSRIVVQRVKAAPYPASGFPVPHEVSTGAGSRRDA